ncbi:MAG TPA: hypothetical protein VNM22_13255 [Candidatus Limnocylindrales bacterium]|nr:hypothetical protein [Candidatus Limnocylindrales bacterium]
MNYQHLIAIEPGKLDDKTCIRSMRSTIFDGLEYLAAGISKGKERNPSKLTYAGRLCKLFFLFIHTNKLAGDLSSIKIKENSYTIQKASEHLGRHKRD